LVYYISRRYHEVQPRTLAIEIKIMAAMAVSLAIRFLAEIPMRAEIVNVRDQPSTSIREEGGAEHLPYGLTDETTAKEPDARTESKSGSTANYGACRREYPSRNADAYFRVHSTSARYQPISSVLFTFIVCTVSAE
jgi:hypothetical protein